MTESTIPQKICTKCHTLKPLSKFTTDKRNKDGHGARCYSCMGEYNKSRAGSNSVATQTCVTCNQTLPANAFNKSGLTLTGLRYHCRTCDKKANEAYKQSDKWKAVVERKKQEPKPNVKEKQCSKCKIIKLADQFYKSIYANDGLNSQCISCFNIYNKTDKHRAKNRERYRQRKALNPEEENRKAREYRKRQKQTPEGRRSIKNSRLKNLYGITIEQYEMLADKQNHQCAICQQSPTDHQLHVDHSHTTGEIRGLLCRRCNLALGFWDHPNILRVLLKYIDPQNFPNVELPL